MRRNASLQSQQTSPSSENAKEIHELHKRIQELEKENLCLKKSGGILCKGNQLEAYRFIDEHKEALWVTLVIKAFPYLSKCLLQPEDYLFSIATF